MGRRVQLALIAVAGFALAVVPALGSDQSIGTGPGNVFSPDNVTVDVGDTVTISNTSMGFHNVHWEDRANAEMPVSPTWSTSRQFDKAGTYRFYCEQHGGPNGAGMSAVVTVQAPGGTTTQTQPTTTTTQTQTQTQTGTTSTTPPATTTDTTPTATTTTPSQSTVADRKAPSLRARNGSLRRRIQLAFTVSERARIVAVIRGAGVRTTVRFVLVPGNRRRTILRHARPGRYTVSLTATDEAGNRARTVRKIVHVRGR